MPATDAMTAAMHDIRTADDRADTGANHRTDRTGNHRACARANRSALKRTGLADGRESRDGGSKGGDFQEIPHGVPPGFYGCPDNSHAPFWFPHRNSRAPTDEGSRPAQIPQQPHAADMARLLALG
jgi:hypothetical protein